MRVAQQGLRLDAPPLGVGRGRVERRAVMDVHRADGDVRDQVRLGGLRLIGVRWRILFEGAGLHDLDQVAHAPVLVAGRIRIGRVEDDVAGHLLGLLDAYLHLGAGDDFALLGQDPRHDPAALQPGGIGVAELRDQDHEIGGGLGQASPRLARLGRGEASAPLAVDVLAHGLGGDLGVRGGTETTEFTEGLGDRLDDDAQAGQAAHRRSDGRRVKPLLAGVDADGRDQPVGERAEEDLVEAALDEQRPVIPRRPLAEAGVGVGADVEGVLPGDIEGDRLDGLGVGGVVERLEDQGPDDGVEVLGRASQLAGEVGRQLADREVGQEMLAKDGGPGAVEDPAAFLAEVSPGVEEVAGLVVADGEHATSIAPPLICQNFCRPVNI